MRTIFDDIFLLLKVVMLCLVVSGALIGIAKLLDKDIDNQLLLRHSLAGAIFSFAIAAICIGIKYLLT